jgi:hypothetical protein
MSTLVNACQVYLRAGWSLGNVKDRYVFAGPGGDQVVGRAVSGLPTTTTQFSVLPPHFTREDLELISDIWPQIHPDFVLFPGCFQKLFPFLLASLIYHQNFLQRWLPSNHPIFLAPIFQNRLEKLGGKTVVEYFQGKILLGNFYCEITGLQASGIPPTIMVMRKVDEQTDKIDQLLNFIKGPLMEQLTRVPQSTIDAFYSSNLTIDGAPVNMALLQSMILELKTNIVQSNADSVARIEEVLLNRVHALFDSRIPAHNALSSVSSTDTTEGYSNYYWESDGSYHWFPIGYKFKAQNIETSWRLWFYGDNVNKIAPLRQMYEKRRNRLVDFQGASEQQAFSRLSFIMKQCENLIHEDGQTIPTKDSTEADQLFRTISQRLLEKVYGDGHPTEFYTLKLNRISVSTFANNLTTKKDKQPVPSIGVSSDSSI